jgi:hypothetical protein
MVQPRAWQHAHQSMARRCCASLVVAVRGGGGRGGRGGVGGTLTGDGAAVKQSGDGSKAVAIEGTRRG